MSDKVYKIRDRNTGHWYGWVYNAGPNSYGLTISADDSQGGVAVTLKEARKVMSWVRYAEIVEFTLSDPRVVTNE